MNKEFFVKEKIFEGPFEKLLELIEKKKLSINEISLSKITDDYINFLRENEFRLVDATKFIWVASILILIKSKSLLPKMIINQEDKDDINELENRLKIFQIFKNASKKIEKKFGQKIIYKKLIKRKVEVEFRPHKNINTKNLLLALDNLVSRYHFEEELEKKEIKKEKSLKEIMDEVKTKINRYLKLTFSELVIGADKKEQAISFLTILELFRHNYVDLKQEGDFKEIIIHKKDTSKENIL